MIMLISEPMKSLLPYIQIILSVLLVAAILIQRTGAQVGGAFGGSDNFSSAFHTRRGVEKGLFIATIIIAILFGLSALVNII
ncbi:MAG: preprotein translocase subunit SecG [Candidatus Paceibacterota bacterium]